MFCSNCGKTIVQGAQSCAHCGMVIGSGEFMPAAYVASQPLLSQGAPAPDAQPRYARFTRTTYTSMEQKDDGDVFRRTSYRPVLQDEPAPEPVVIAGEESTSEDDRPDDREVPEERAPARDDSPDPVKEHTAPSGAAPVQGNPEELPESIRSKPLRPVRLAGISPQMQERMRALEAQQDAVESDEPKRPSRPIVSSLFSAGGRGANSRAPHREQPVQTDDAPQSAEAKDAAPEARTPAAVPASDTADAFDYDAGEEDVFDIDDIGDDEENAPRRGLFRRREPDELRSDKPLSKGASILRTALIALCVVAILIGGFVWLSLRTAARSPISGVTYSLYEQGVKMIETRAGEAYRAELMALYAQDATGATAAVRHTEDRAALTALLPGTTLANDQSFLNALLAIETSIENAIATDALIAADVDGTLTALAGSSVERWLAIDNAITRLKQTTNALELAAIGDSASFTATPTPEPTPTVSPYSTLTKGMTDNADVLAMQNRLYELGWFTDVRDGDFGAVTQSSVKLFQQAVGLAVTGIADSDTLSAIYAEDAPRTGNRITPAPTSGSDDAVAPANPN